MKRIVVRPRVQTPLLVVFFGLSALVGAGMLLGGDPIAKRNWGSVTIGALVLVFGMVGVWRAVRMGVVVDERVHHPAVLNHAAKKKSERSGALERKMELERTEAAQREKAFEQKAALERIEAAQRRKALELRKTLERTEVAQRKKALEQKRKLERHEVAGDDNGTAAPMREQRFRGGGSALRLAGGVSLRIEASR